MNTLRQFWRAVDGVTRTPFDEVRAPAVPKTIPIAVKASVIRDVEAQLRAHEEKGWLRTSKTRARFMVLAAWRTFIAANAWGPFDTRSYARRLATAGWPRDVRPYNLRHSVGLALSEQGEDLADVQAWMGHTSIRTTRDFYVPVIGSRLQRASAGLDGRLEWSFSTARVARAGGTLRKPKTSS